MIGQKFATPKVDYWCAPPKNTSFEKWSTSRWRAFSSPYVANQNVFEHQYDHCQVYDVSYDETLANIINGNNATHICICLFRELNGHKGRMIQKYVKFSLYRSSSRIKHQLKSKCHECICLCSKKRRKCEFEKV